MPPNDFLINIEKSARRGALFFRDLTKIKSTDEDKKRREVILTILLLISICLFAAAILVSFVDSLTVSKTSYQNNSLSILAIVLILLLLLFLYLLLKKGFLKVAAYVFVSIFFLLATYMAYHWGADVPAGLAFYMLTITMSGILINSRSSFSIAILISLTLIILSWLQKNSFVITSSYWRIQKMDLSDSIMLAIIFNIIATISWLSNREIEKSLLRAKNSEAELKNERDLLEINVRERTKELQQAQIEKMMQMHRFAEFGRLAGGLFHDLMNPLTAISLIFENNKINYDNKSKIKEMITNLGIAQKSRLRIDKLIASVRKQMSDQKISENFSLNREIDETIQILAYRARKNRVSMIFKARQKIKIVGNPVKFNQIVTNLVANSIDSYAPVKGNDIPSRKVEIELAKLGKTVSLTVRDWGAGIPADDMEKIFEPFFTTKKFQEGLGIGLPLVKEMAEEYFNGQIKVESAENKGSTFTFTFTPKL